MVAAAAPDTQADARELARPDVDARRLAPARRRDAVARGERDDRVLESDDQLAHADAAAAAGRRVRTSRAGPARGRSPGRRGRCRRPGCRPVASRCSGLPFRPWVKTGACSRNQSSSGVPASRASVKRLHRAPGRRVVHAAELADDRVMRPRRSRSRGASWPTANWISGSPAPTFSSSCVARAASVPGGTTSRTRVVISVKRLLPSMRSSMPSTSAVSSRHSKREAFAIARKVIIMQSPTAASSSVSGDQ